MNRLLSTNVIFTVFLLVGFAVLSFMASQSMAGTVVLPQTGQTTCYDESGNMIDCAGTGQDGDILAGGDWPDLRFTDNGDGTVTDNLTGLMWLKDGDCFRYNTIWQEALDLVADFNSNPNNYNCQDYTANYTDWKLPNVNELESLINTEETSSSSASWLNGQGFVNVHWGSFWTSTTNTYNTDEAWRVSMYGHVGNGGNKTAGWYDGHVWPVRGGQTGSIGNSDIWKTGQTTCYDEPGNMIDCAGTGQDGNILAGVDWPDPRFTDKGDGTVTDNLTGLVWLKDATCLGYMTWQSALDVVSNFRSDPGYYDCTSNIATNGDWRLPNRKELFSLIDHSEYEPALPPLHPFSNVQWNFFYWSSTNFSWDSTTDAPYAWAVNIRNGIVGNGHKSSYAYVWLVNGSFGNPAISVSPTSHNFGSIDVGSSSIIQTFSISNIGDADLLIESISVIDTDTAEFSKQNDTCSGQTVAQSDTCTFDVEFSPTSDGSKSAKLEILSNDPDTPTLGVSLSGTGVIQQYTLTITKTGSGTGTVTSGDGNINCGITCTATHNADTIVTLTATPDSGSTFAGWTGDVCSGTGSCVVSLKAPSTVTANFTVTAISCIYTTSPTSQAFTSSGGSGSISITTSNGCSWDATSNAGWITITSGSSGDGGMTVEYAVSENTSTDSRTSTMTIAGETFTVRQTAPPVSSYLKVEFNQIKVHLNNGLVKIKGALYDFKACENKDKLDVQAMLEIENGSPSIVNVGLALDKAWVDCKNNNLEVKGYVDVNLLPLAKNPRAHVTITVLNTRESVSEYIQLKTKKNELVYKK